MISFLTGDNTYAINQKLLSAKDAYVKNHGQDSLEQYEADEFQLDRLPDLVGGVSLFSDKRMVIIKNIGANKELAGKLADNLDKIDDSIDLILTQPAADKRTDWYKKLKRYSYEQTPLAKGAILPWLKKEAQKRGIDLSIDLLELMVQRTGEDQWRLSNELDKLALLGPKIDRQKILQVVEPSDEENVFALVDQALSGKSQSALKTYSRTSSQGMDAFSFISTLSWQLGMMMVIKLNKNLSPAEIANQTGGSLWVIRRVKPMADRLSYSQLEQLVDLVLQTDYRLKTRSEQPEQRIKWLIGSMSEIIS